MLRVVTVAVQPSEFTVISTVAVMTATFKPARVVAVVTVLCVMSLVVTRMSVLFRRNITFENSGQLLRLGGANGLVRSESENT